MLNSHQPRNTLGVLQLTAKHTWLQIKLGHNWLVITSLATLFFYLCFVTLVAQGTNNYLAKNLQDLLGADTVLQIGRPLPNDSLTELKQASHATSLSQLYKITLTHRQHHQRVQLKAVDDYYPLQGKLEYSHSKGFQGVASDAPPALNEIWLEPRLASALAVNIGDNIQLGTSILRFSAYLLHEPDRLHEGHSSDMRALVHSKSIVSEHLRVKQYRYLFNHEDAQITHFQQLANTLADSQLYSKALGKHPVSAIYKRVEKFLGLLSVLLIILAGTTLQLSQHKTCDALTRFIAICLANGMTAKNKLPMILINSLLILAVSLIPAFLLALLGAQLLEQYLNNLMQGFMLIWQPLDLLQAIVLCALLYLGLSGPTLFKVYRTETIQLLSSHNPLRSQRILNGLFLFFVMISVVYWYSDNWTLTALLLGSVSLCLISLVILNLMLLNVGKFSLLKTGTLLRFTLYLMRQRIYTKAAQMIALGLSILLLFMCTRIHQDVTSMLEHFKYEQQGNLLITQVDPSQTAALNKFLANNNSELKELYHYQYAQLTHINSVLLKDAKIPISDTLRSVQNPIRLHWNTDLPHNNKIVMGEWRPQTQGEEITPVSIEDEVFRELNLALGDVIKMQMSDVSLSFKIASVHRFVSGASNITFWFVAQTAEPNKATPVYGMGSAQLSEAAWQELALLWKAYPTMRLHSIDSILSQTRQYLNILTGAVFLYSVLICILTVLLLIAAVQRHLQLDKKRNGLLLSFGLDKTQQFKIALYEWLIVSTLPTLSAFVCVYFTMGAFYKYELSLTYKPDHLLLITQAILIIVAITSIGLLTTKKQFTYSVRELLVED